MNFVEAAPVIAPRLAVEEVAEAPVAVEKPAVPSKAKVFGVAFAMSAAVFTFTLIGMITTVNTVTDEIVIPQLYGRIRAELQTPTMELLPTDTEPAAVETTSAH